MSPEKPQRTPGARNISSGGNVVGHISRHFQNSEKRDETQIFRTVAFILIPSLVYAAGGGGTGISNAGNGDPSGANSDASNGNTPVGPAGANVGNSASDRAGKRATRARWAPQRRLSARMGAAEGSVSA